MNRTLTVLVCIMVAGVVVGASLPIFDSLTASSESVHNDGAGWVRFTLDRNAGTEYTVLITEDENGVYVMNGDDVQTYDDSSTEDFETILYADSNVCVWWDSAACHVMGIKDGNPLYFEDTVGIGIVRDSSGVTITPVGYSPMTFGVPEWAYVPASAGSYGFFAYDEDRGVQNYPSNMPLAVVGGGFAGVYAYNDIYRYNGLGLRMNPIYQDDLFFGATWAIPTESDESVDPSSITLDPISIPNIPIIDIDDPFNPEPDTSIMSMPTPTYTDGVWGYEYNGDGATIVSYSGTGGNIIMPDTVGGRTVLAVGKGGSNQTVFDNSTLLNDSTLTLPSTIKTINSHAFRSCDKLTGSLIIPDGVTSIGASAFRGCSGFTGSLTLPSSLTSIGASAFDGCSGFTGSLVIPSNITMIGADAFKGVHISNLIVLSDYDVTATNPYSNSMIREVLNLSTQEYTTTTGGLNAEEVSDNIGDCFGYISIVDLGGSGGSVTQTLIAMLPLIMVLGLVLVAVGSVIWSRM